MSGNEIEMNTATSRSLLSTNEPSECNDEIVHQAEGVAESEDAPSPSSSDFYSWVELGACLIFVIASLVLEAKVIDPRERPIPYQLLDTGEYVVNQVFNESFENETVSSKYIAFCLSFGEKI